jgi:hypothetical protein
MGGLAGRSRLRFEWGNRGWRICRSTNMRSCRRLFGLDGLGGLGGLGGVAAVTDAVGPAGDDPEPGWEEPQPASATSATSAAAVTEKHLLMSPGRRSPAPGCVKRRVTPQSRI